MLSGPSTRRLIAYQLASLGFYYFYWCSVSRREINRVLDRIKIPSTWLLIVPGLNYWWMWLYAEGLESVTRLRLKRSDTFLLYLISTASWGLLDPGIRLSNDYGSRSFKLTHHTLVVLLIAIAVLIFVVIWAGNTFYACIMQRKIDTVRGRKPR